MTADRHIGAERATALHEAGHAVMAYRLHQVVGSISIEPDEAEDSLGALFTVEIRTSP